MTTQIDVKFETDSSRPFLAHKGRFVPLDNSGKGSFTVQDNEWDLTLFGIDGTPGDTAKITLSVPAPATLEVAGHPIKGKIAQGKIVWGASRFFRVKR